MTPTQNFAVGLLLTALCQASLIAQGQPLAADRSQGAAAVDVAQCKAWLGQLASPEFEGRQTGYPGFKKAADFVANHFASLSLQARGENGSYFQTVPWTTATAVAEETYVAFTHEGNEVLRIPADRLAGRATADSEASGEVVLLAITPPAMPETSTGNRRMVLPTIDGLADVDVKDKVVLVYIKEQQGKVVAPAMVRFAVQRELAGKNPQAVLTLQTAATTGGLRGRTGANRGSGRAIGGGRRSPLDAAFGGADFTAFCKAAGLDEAKLASDQLAHPLPLRANVKVKVIEQQGPATNVWAVLPGSDPKLKDEYVVIGSHLDHVGLGGGLHPGADDDASGTTGVMAVATMFVKNDLKPKRSVLFVCFCGEEDGLVGSGYFAKNPPVPLSSIVGELQMDMIGRDEEENREGDRGELAENNRNTLHLVGTQKLAPQLHELCLQKNGTAGFELEYDQEGMFSRSDHANFARMGVPIAFFFTGLHKDYHETTDTPDKIHYEKLLRVAKYVYDIGFELGTQAGRPQVDPALWENYRGKGSEQPAAPMAQPAGGK